MDNLVVASQHIYEEWIVETHGLIEKPAPSLWSAGNKLDVVMAEYDTRQMMNELLPVTDSLAVQ